MSRSHGASQRTPHHGAPQDSGDAQKLVQSAVKTIELNERQVPTRAKAGWVLLGDFFVNRYGSSMTGELGNLCEDFLRLLLLIFLGVLMWDPQVTMALYGFQY